MTESKKQNKGNQLDEETIKQIQEIIKNEIKNIRVEILEEITSKLKEYLSEEGLSIDPHKKLEEWNKDAMERIKDELIESIQKGDIAQQKKLEMKAEKMDRMVREVASLIQIITDDEKKLVHNSNPLYEPKVYRWLPGLNKLLKRQNERSSRNWLGLLFTGIGLIFISRGVWDASYELFSVQGSIITGAVILGLMAWLERRKIFAIFGQE